MNLGPFFAWFDYAHQPKNRAFRNSPSTAAHPLPNGRDSFAVATIPCPKTTFYIHTKPQKRVDFAQNYS